MTVVWSALRSRLFAALTGMDKDSLEPYLDRMCERLVNGVAFQTDEYLFPLMLDITTE